MHPLHNNLFLGRTSESFQMVRLGVDVFHSRSVCQWRFNAPREFHKTIRHQAGRSFIAFVLRFLLQEVDPWNVPLICRDADVRSTSLMFCNYNISWMPLISYCFWIQIRFDMRTHLIGTFTRPLPHTYCKILFIIWHFSTYSIVFSSVSNNYS